MEGGATLSLWPALGRDGVRAASCCVVGLLSGQRGAPNGGKGRSWGRVKGPLSPAWPAFAALSVSGSRSLLYSG
jgi:hypothetical protein